MIYAYQKQKTQLKCYTNFNITSYTCSLNITVSDVVRHYADKHSCLVQKLLKIVLL